MIPGDIGAELAGVLRAAVAAGELPAAAAGVSAAGTWRPAPPGEGGPGTYATSVPLLLARGTGEDARVIAARLAAALEPVAWIAQARGSGAGYLTIAVTTGHLAALPARIVAAGPQAGPAAPPVPDPAAAPDWPSAWRRQHDALARRLAVAAGQDDRNTATEHHDTGDRQPPSSSSSEPGTPSRSPWPATADRAGRGPVASGPVASAVAWWGIDAVRYVLARTPGPRSAAIERGLRLRLDLDNPFVLVRYAHAHAASTARWAADLARAAGPVAGAGGPEPRFAAAAGEPEPDPRPAELALISSLSWSRERLGAAARRRRPAELCADLEHVAAAYLRCAQDCPALPSGGAAAPPGAAGPWAARRLELAAAARVVLAGGLRLAGVSCPAELFQI